MDYLTIAILNYNSGTQLKKCLESIPVSIAGTHIEKIVIDNSSEDNSWKAAEEFGFKVIHADNKHFFITGINKAIESFEGEYLLFSQADLVFEKNCISRLLKAIEERQDSIIQPVFFTPQGKIDNAGMNWVWPGYGLGIHWILSNSIYQTDIATSITFITSRKVLDKVGHFDTRFSPAYYEDCDYAIRCKKLWIKHYVEPMAHVTHWHNSAFSKIYSKPELSEICYINRLMLVEKHYKGLDRRLRLKVIHAAQYLRNAISSLGNKTVEGSS